MNRGFSEIYRRIVLGRPIVVLAVLASVLCFFGYHTKGFKLDSSADTLLLEDDRDLKLYRAINEQYRIRDFLVVSFTPDDDLFSERSLALLKQLKTELGRLDHVESVVTILDVPLLKAADTRLSEMTGTHVKTLADPALDREKAKKELLESPVYRNFIISADGRTAAIQINLENDDRYSKLLKQKNRLQDKKRTSGLDPNETSELAASLEAFETARTRLNALMHRDIQQIRSIIAPYRQHGTLHLGGVPMIADDMIAFIERDLMVFGFGVFVFIVATLTLLFRKARWVILPLLSCSYAVVIMIGMLGLLNWKVTVISSNFISLMLILTLSMTIHLVIRYIQLCGKLSTADPKEIVFASVKKMVWPCLYTALTTILAFSTLVFSGIKPVIDFGWMMTIGLSVTFCTSFLLLPAIMALLDRSETPAASRKTPALLSQLALITEHHGGKVMVLSVLLAAVSVIGISGLRVENSFINYFKKKTEIYQGMKLMDDRLGGTNPLDIVLNFGDLPGNDATDAGTSGKTEGTDEPGYAADDPFGKDSFGWINDYDPKDYWFTPLKIETIKRVHDYLDSLPEVGKVLSFASIVRVAEGLQSGKALDSLELALLYKKLPQTIKSSVVDPFISIEANEARISLRVLDSMEGIRRKELIDKIRHDLTGRFGFKGDRAKVSGVLVLYNNMLQSLFRSQILTLGTVMMGIAAMFLVLFRSVPLCIIGIVPNLLAVGVVLGIMGLADIPLDMMTITIAAITMGIGVDNSIHYIYRFREEYALNGSYTDTLRICHGSIGRAILNTSVTIIFGFSILILSNFIPTVYFGIFTGLAMGIALLAVLTLLPKLILLWKPL